MARQSPASYMESAADWPPPAENVSRKPKVAQFCAAPWPNFTPALTAEWQPIPSVGATARVARVLHHGRERRCPDLAGDVDGRLDIAERVMGIVRAKAIQRCDAVQLEAHPAIGIHRPFEQFGPAVPDGIERGQNIEAGVAVELSSEDVGLKVLVEGLAQHLLVEADAVEPRPDRGRPAFDQRADFLRELEERRECGIHQLRRAYAGNRQCPRRRNDVRRDTAAQIGPFDLPELAIRQNGGELERLIEGRRCSGGFKIVESEILQRSLTVTGDSVIQQSART